MNTPINCCKTCVITSFNFFIYNRIYSQFTHGAKELQVVVCWVFLACVLWAWAISPANASCPVSVAGQYIMTYNNGTKFMAACKFGDSLRNLCGVTGAACTAGQEGDVEYNTAGNVLRYCNASNWINVQCESLGSCAGTTAGTISADATQMKYCNGTTWQAMYNDGICTGIGVQEALFTPNASTEGEDTVHFGASQGITMTDDYMVIGAHRATRNSILDGAATVYKRSGATWTRLKELVPSPIDTFDYFGQRVSMDGDYVIVGAGGRSTVYFFKKDSGGADNWGQIAVRSGNSWHGEAVDLEGDQAIAGGYAHNATVVDQGRARIYRRDRGGADAWGEVVILDHPDVDKVNYDRFGRAVAIAADVAVVGAYERDESGVANAGAVYLYRETALDTWSYHKKLLNPNGLGASDLFGYALDIKDLDNNGTADRLVVTAYGDDTQVGDRGTIYIYERDEGGANNWGLVAQTSDATVSPTSRHVGFDVTLAGDYIISGSRLNDENGVDAGAGMIFRKDEGGANNWGLQTYVWGGDTDTLDELGRGVAASETGNYAAFGAIFRQNAGAQPGAVYAFSRSGATWTQQQKLTPPGTYQYSVRMGDSVAVSGDYAAVSMIYQTDRWTTFRSERTGAVNIYQRQPNATWILDKHLVPTSPPSDMQFGATLDVSPEYMVVGVPLDNGPTRSGGAIIFGRNVGGAGNWGEIKKIKPSDAESEDRAGEFNGLSLFGDYIVLGAFREDRDLVFPQIDAGAAYIFHRNQGGADNWGEIKKIVSSVTENSANFGNAVDMGGTTLAVGARLEDANGGNSGAVYLFERDQGGLDNWGQVKRLVGESANDQYGYEVAVSGDTLAIGAPYDDDAGTNTGTVYIYYRNNGGANNWGLEKKQIYSGAGAGDAAFGQSIDLSGDILIVGAPLDDTNQTDGGYTYVYSRNEGGNDNWGLLATIDPNVPGEGDYFGFSVAVSGNVVASSGLYNDDFGVDDGSVYLFGCPPVP